MLLPSGPKSEVQSLVAFVGRGLQVMNPLFTAHAIPDLISLAVSRHIVRLHKYEDAYIPSYDAQQSLIASIVIWFVLRAVDLRGDDVGKLHSHVVQ